MKPAYPQERWLPLNHHTRASTWRGWNDTVGAVRKRNVLENMTGNYEESGSAGKSRELWHPEEGAVQCDG